ncbi:hypothetical protein ABC795_09285 [Blastococcus sp. HT6-30]|uniref:hypothetical protein n=1 Tax=Blastococcus sp. HT6-30 TaxID=3144843 RepID=UPI00321A9337
MTAPPGARRDLLDVKLPDATGFEMLVRLRGDAPALPVWSVIAKEPPGTPRRSHRRGATTT